MLVVAGLNLRNLEPRVWDSSSPYFLRSLRAVMVSYADFHRNATQRDRAIRLGLRAFLGLPRQVSVFLDNGSFYFSGQNEQPPLEQYEEFADAVTPDWMPIPRDYIPLPTHSRQKQRVCFDKTDALNRRYSTARYAPVIHIGCYLPKYLDSLSEADPASGNSHLALGGIVPNLLRKPKALPYPKILQSLRDVRELFAEKQIHVFGVGGTATLHLASLLKFDSVDSSGWRNRAARGIVQLPGSGDRRVAPLGSWGGRTPSEPEWEQLKRCSCPSCARFGLEGLRAKKLHGFCCRATHNLWVLLEEQTWITRHLRDGSYPLRYKQRVNNSTYKSLVTDLVRTRFLTPSPSAR